MKTDLGKPQYLEYLTYLDCKKRTKKQVEAMSCLPHIKPWRKI